MTDKFKGVLNKRWVVLLSDLVNSGEKLGYDWEQVFDAQQDGGVEDIYDCNYQIIERSTTDGYVENPIVNHILVELFKEHPDVKEIYVIFD